MHIGKAGSLIQVARDSVWEEHSCVLNTSVADFPSILYRKIYKHKSCTSVMAVPPHPTSYIQVPSPVSPIQLRPLSRIGLASPFCSVSPVPSSIPAQVPSPSLRYSWTCLALPFGLVARDPALTLGPTLPPLSLARVRSAFCLVFARISEALCLLTRSPLSPFTPSARVFKPTLLPVLFARFGIDFDNSTLLLSSDLLHL